MELNGLATTADSTVAKVRTFISIGSILNRAWNPSIVSGDRFRRSILSHILWSEHDERTRQPRRAERPI